ncbi:MAG: twitching motility protein PilT [Gammaproteobacteria bacterium]
MAERREAEAAAVLSPKTRNNGLSLADCACLALGFEREAPVLTADRTWAEIDRDLGIRVMRGPPPW